MLKKSNPKLCFEEKKRTKNISIKKKIEEEKEVLRKKQEEQSVEIEEDFDFGMTP